MKYSVILATVAFILSLCAAEADPMPVGSETMPLQADQSDRRQNGQKLTPNSPKHRQQK